MGVKDPNFEHSQNLISVNHQNFKNLNGQGKGEEITHSLCSL